MVEYATDTQAAVIRPRIFDRNGVSLAIDGLSLSVTIGEADAVLDVPAASELRRVLDLFVNDRDPLAAFIARHVSAAPGKRVQATVLHRAFSAWLEASGEG